MSRELCSYDVLMLSKLGSSFVPGKLLKPFHVMGFFLYLLNNINKLHIKGSLN